ncbi:hypothetical protein CVU37_00215 [candidate division BRC1 bacterium HGW-BRC1-1]|nr:MAG: hypothetical protein CVU37_00215 [candidate division BRC1 bacterium HGW-BRC1-1]
MAEAGDDDDNKVLSFKDVQAILAAEGADSAASDAINLNEEEENEDRADEENELLEAAAETNPSPATNEKSGGQKTGKRRNKRDKNRKDRSVDSSPSSEPQASVNAQEPDAKPREQLSTPPSPAPEENPEISVSEESGPSTEQHPSVTVEKEIKLWEAALDNRSAAIRKQAVARLKKLTGKDYAN